MRIEVLDGRRGVLRVRIDNEDDLWLLSILVSPGDLVKALTLRDVSLGYEKRRVPMILTLRVLKTEFQPFTNRLRIHGVVIEGPDRFGVRGSHHTISVDVGSEVTIYKQSWSPKLLDELLRLVRPIRLLLVALDFDEYAIALIQSQGVKIIDSKSISLPISDDLIEKVKSDVFKEIAKRIIESAQRLGVNSVIIASPGSLKDELASIVRELASWLKIYTDTIANGGYAGIQELLNRDSIHKVLHDLAVAEATKVLTEFEYLLAKDSNRVVYGLDDVELSAELGAVEKLVIVDEMLSSFDEVRGRVERLLREVAEKGGRVIIVPTDSPPGQRVRVLGGVIAILRYRLDTELLKQGRSET